MTLSNLVATSALLGLTIVGAHAGSADTAATAADGPAAGGSDYAPAGGGRQGRGNAVFLQQQRPPGDPAVIERGRTLYSVTCSACHGVDARGGQLGGPNLLRSQLVLADQDGEAIIPVIQGGPPGQGHAADAGQRGRRQGARDVPAQPARGRGEARIAAACRHAATGCGRRGCGSRSNVLCGEVHELSFGDGRPPGHCWTSPRREDAAESLGIRRRRGRGAAAGEAEAGGRARRRSPSPSRRRRERRPKVSFVASTTSS